ncbi:solute carrier family 25 member 44-like [Montipora capricornis]|uniref:solute carrier family 25 member 44-like n=1 Tax=Montipora capricornis TaxID=246305 RepID=UPI0035F10967
MPEEVRNIEWEEMDKRKFYFFGPTLFLGIRALLYPANLVKTRLQVQRKNALYKGSFDAFVKVVRFEGIRGLYKGFLVNCFGLLSGQCYITTLELVKMRTKNYNLAVRGFVAGGIASIVGQTITVPVDVISQKLMVQGQGGSSNKLKGASAIAREIVKSDGPLGLYRGYLISLMTYAPTSAIWWFTYGAYTGLVGSIVISGTPHLLVLATAGALAGFTTSTVTNPLDIMRTRLQVGGGKSTYVIHMFRTLLQEEGPMGLTKGLSARMLSMVSSSVVVVLGYETVKRLSLKTSKIDMQVQEEGYLEASF